MRGEINGEMKTERAGERLWEKAAQPHNFLKVPAPCISRPTEHQAILLQRLGLHLPTSLEMARV